MGIIKESFTQSWQEAKKKQKEFEKTKRAEMEASKKRLKGILKSLFWFWK